MSESSNFKVLYKFTDDSGEELYVLDYPNDNERYLYSLTTELCHTGINLNDDKSLLTYNEVQEFFRTHAVTPSTALVLGAAGCMLPRYLINNFGTKVAAVEISEKMIDVAKKYFFADSYGDKLQLIHADAFDYIETCKEKFDLIFIDTFITDIIDSRVNSENTIISINKLIVDGGIVVLNCYNMSEEYLQDLKSKITRIFSPTLCETFASEDHDKGIILIK